MRSARRLSAPHMDSGRPRLARVRRQPQSVVFGVSVNAAKQFRRSFLLVTADAHADHVPIPVTRRQFENALCLFHAEMPGCIENPQQ